MGRRIINNRALKKAYWRLRLPLVQSSKMVMLTLSHGEEMTVSDIVAMTQMEQPTVSGVLNLLLHSGYVCRRREGKWVYYRINEFTIRKINRTVKEFNHQSVKRAVWS